MAWFINDLQKLIGKWADENLSEKRDPMKAFLKIALEELPELYSAFTDKDSDLGDELADVFIILFDLAYLHSINVEKVVVNKLKLLDQQGMELDHRGIYKRNK